MDSFDNRERDYENAFAHEASVSFCVRMASLRKLGRWAAEKLQHVDPDALAARALQGADDETLLADLAGDLQSVGLSAHRVRMRYATFTQEAAREIHGWAASGANQATTCS